MIDVDPKLLKEEKFSLNFNCKTSVFEKCDDGRFELVELYYLEGGKTKYDVLRRNTGKIYRYVTHKDKQEKLPGDVVVYDPETFEPRLFRLIEDKEKNLKNGFEWVT